MSKVKKVSWATRRKVKRLTWGGGDEKGANLGRMNGEKEEHGKVNGDNEG